jgi:hypothetical protein
MLVTFMTPVSDRHRPVLALLVYGYLMLGMRLAFRAVGSHRLGDFHTDHLSFVNSACVVYLLLMELGRLTFRNSDDASNLNLLRCTLLDQRNSVLVG